MRVKSYYTRYSVQHLKSDVLNWDLPNLIFIFVGLVKDPKHFNCYTAVTGGFDYKMFCIVFPVHNSVLMFVLRNHFMILLLIFWNM
jgi:hypothetical protein